MPSPACSIWVQQPLRTPARAQSGLHAWRPLCFPCTTLAHLLRTLKLVSLVAGRPAGSSTAHPLELVLAACPAVQLLPAAPGFLDQDVKDLRVHLRTCRSCLSVLPTAPRPPRYCALAYDIDHLPCRRHNVLEQIHTNHVVRQGKAPNISPYIWCL